MKVARVSRPGVPADRRVPSGWSVGWETRGPRSSRYHGLCPFIAAFRDERVFRQVALPAPEGPDENSHGCNPWNPAPTDAAVLQGTA
jgi:hypothetical protein